MTDRQPHCPFLNRSDARCGTHFSLTRLDTAFDQCFGCYASCPTYHEMLAERRTRQQQQGHTPGAVSYAIAQQSTFVQVRVPATAA